MKKRIASLLDLEIFDLTVSTFHSFCARLLRREAGELGYPKNFTIFDEDDALAMVKNCMAQLDITPNQFPPRSQRRKISTAKNNLQDAAAFSAKAGGYFETRTAKLYTLYEQRLRECGAMDFDDLIFLAVRLLRTHEDIKMNYQNRFKYIMVDEYQDTNQGQYQLLKLLVGAHRNICVVGDEDQSIYGWRGADISNILNFESDFPGAQVIKLEQNYRSTETILNAASAVIANNVSRKGKTLWTEIKSGDKLNLFLTDSASDEASVIIGEIEKKLPTCSLKESAILYRTNAQSRAFEEAMRRIDFPYQIIGGVSFYMRKEIKDLLAYLKLIANPADDISFQRIINYPKRGIGRTTLDRLAQFARDRGESMYETSRHIDDCPDLGDRPKRLIGIFAELMDSFMQSKNDIDIAELTQMIVDKLRLVEELAAEDPIVGQGRVENIEEFISAVSEFTVTRPEPTLENFLAEISLYTDLDEYKEVEDKLTLMTLHSAKGLEYDAIYMVGLEDGLFPLARTFEHPMELEEERRLFYVGATRAKKFLSLSMATVRNRFGESESIPSRFLKELPPDLVNTADLRSQRRHRTVSDRPQKTTAPSGVHYEYEADEILRVGRIVQHPTFGRGKVISVEGTGEALRLEVYFTGVGAKRIMVKYARLKVVG
jgi:DNA helicase-2/ATP-dependent DNA helicase PcrA